MVKAERRTGEVELAYRFSQYEGVLARHSRLLQELGGLSGSIVVENDRDPVTYGPTLEKRHQAASRILPALLSNPHPLGINRREPIPQPSFGNPLRWCLNNLTAVIPEEPVDLIELIDCIHLAYDVIYGSYDVRSMEQTGRIPLYKRERIGGSNDHLSEYEAIKGSVRIRSFDDANMELSGGPLGCYRKGIQAAIYGMPVIKYQDFLDDLGRVGGYARNQTDQWGHYPPLPINEELTYEDIRIIFETISTIGEYKMARKPLEDERLKKLTSGGIRIDADLVRDSWFVRT